MVRSDSTREISLHGLGIAPGIAIGPAYLVKPGVESVPYYNLMPDAVADELARLEGAVAKSRKQIDRLREKSSALPQAAAEEIGFLLEAHASMLGGSRLMRGITRRISEERINAEAAVVAEIQVIADSFAGLEDSYIASRAKDVREVGMRVVRNLIDYTYKAFSGVPLGSVILAEELTPADTALLDPARIAGLATVLGGAEGHTAIMARALGLPTVLGIAGIVESAHTGDTIIVDGGRGIVVLNPSPEKLAAYREEAVALDKERRTLKRLRKLPAISRDGVTVTLRANIELPSEAANVIDSGAEGVGLLRTEFLFMNRRDLPGEDEQYQAYRAIVEKMAGMPVTLRTLDVGGDKLAPAFGHESFSSDNPALGLRAIRLSLKEPKLMEAQFAAMLRSGAHGPIRIMLPMISRLEELRLARASLMRVARRLKRKGVPIADPLPPLGIMIEVPAAALSAEGLATQADFFSIGTNDLIQYTLAIDRSDEQVAHLYDPLHPAVLRLIQMTTQAALTARIPIAVCGEMAGDPRFIPLLVGLGVRELSASPPKIPFMKRRIRNLAVSGAVARARAILEQPDSASIAQLLDEFNAGEAD
ncbi:phosphoenolpyruvate--protein phosphotransferase [Radicibacter daui]|uniref:phosphoenolpyruvate--protein phosphotransferase n=1 Tax=Radicibacter daui TaxID=3064829 RepID=UPI004046E6AB